MRLSGWLGLLLFFVSSVAYIHCEEVFGIVGENFTFPVKIDKKIVEIIWTKNKDKVAEWEGQPKPTYFTSLRNRGLLNVENGSLTIFNLEDSDTGVYVLQYLDSVKTNYEITFILAVLRPPSEPKISCNSSGDNVVLKCAADFQKPLYYTWKFDGQPHNTQSQEVSIPENSDTPNKVTCSIKFSQTEKSSEISLTQCFLNKTGVGYHKRSRDGLAMAFVLLIVGVVGILALLYMRARGKLGTGKAAQKNSPVHGSGEQLCSPDSQEQLNSDRAISSQAVEDKELNKEDNPLKDKQMVDNDVNQEELSAMQNKTLTSKCAADQGVTEGEVTQDAEGGNREHPNNSSSKEDQTTVDEKL
ncbi:lymphocyte function-associated antigen 3 isoform X2 [Grus americana]|uniref:lymphocyte function-associated antigen 3 isoform X2 n=1 Tax=Grus americana TaxID=9117 RepID=UPI00240790DC|nr:lymphocyte function-associated antigen 3 isoform X2 [Grus americana]